MLFRPVPVSISVQKMLTKGVCPESEGSGFVNGMRRPTYQWFLAMVFLMGTISGLAQVSADPPQAAQQPILVDDNFLQIKGAQAQFESANQVSDDTKAAIRQGRALSVPYFNNSFSHQGEAYPFTTVGKNPKRGEITSVGTQLIPISMFFEGFADQDGKPITLDVAPVLARFQNSPNFRRFTYGTGLTQFADAVQRAQFFHVMDPDWHTLLDRPRILTPLTIDVPRGSASLFRVRSTGAIFAVVDTGFFVSQLNSIIQLENLDAESLPIALTNNVLLAPSANVQRCCVVGFHTAFEMGERRNAPLVQTFVWGSWIDAGILGTDFADVTAVSHEISEWMNDPFGTNLVPVWQFPNGTAGCQNNLETGDPLETSVHASFPVTIDGFVYHPQNQAMLQWFTRETPSSAIDGAYSYPNESLLTAPSQPCAAK